MYSIASGRWSLYRNASGGVAEIARPEYIAYITPMVQDSDGRLMETDDALCKNTLVYSSAPNIYPVLRRGLCSYGLHSYGLCCYAYVVMH